MQQLGLYEQLITEVLARQLNRQRFYVGERALDAAEAQTQLGRFLSRVFAFALDSISAAPPEYRGGQQIQLANRPRAGGQRH